MGKILDEIRHDENVALANSDPRRVIYDPEQILDGLEGKWYAHNIITLSSEGEGLELGKHYHNYEEVFFTPTGEFNFRFVDQGDLETREYTLGPGSRIFIPRDVGHIVTGRPGNVLMGYGNVPFDSDRLIACPEKALEALASI